MNIPVLLEPIAGGFRASTGAPLNLSAEAPTAELALAAINSSIQARIAAGSKMVELHVPSTSREQELAALLAADPMFDEWVEAMNEYRQEREAEEEKNQAVQDGSRAKAGGPVCTPTPQEPAA